MAKVSILPIGGQDERNKNSYFIKVNQDGFIFNSGLKVPLNNLYGVSSVCPDYKFLKDDKEKVVGVFIGYATFYNFASIQFLLENIDKNTPIFCSEITKIIIETNFEKKSLIFLKNKELNINVVTPLKPIYVGKTEIVPFSICNSIPGSLGWIIKTVDGAIVYLDEFMVNNDKTRIFQNQLGRIESIVKNKTLALIPAMGNVGKHNGFTTPNHKSGAFYQSIVKKAKGRVIVACSDSDAYTIINLAKIAKDTGRPFSIYSNTFMNVFSTLVKNKLINIKGLNCLQISEINDSENAIIVVASSYEQLFKKLTLIADYQAKVIQPKETDTFILGTQMIPGYEGHAAQLLDKLSKLNMDIHVLPKNYLPMTASNEDQKYLLDYLNPKYVFPIQGLYKSFVQYEKCASETKVKNNQIMFLDNGEEVTIINGELQKKNNTRKLAERYISYTGADDTNGSVLFERQKLSLSGSITLTLFFDRENQKFINYLSHQTYGVFVKDDNNLKIVEEIIEQFKKQIANNVVFDQKTKKINHKETKNILKKILMKMFERRFNKRPVVLLCILEIN